MYDAAKDQRDAARAQRDAAVLTSEIHRSGAKAAADAAERLGAEVRENDERCGKALAAARRDADKLRLILRSCQSDEAVERRSGVLFP